MIPNLEALIVYRAEASPLTFQRYAWTRAEAIYGTLAQNGRVPTRTPVPQPRPRGRCHAWPGIEAVVISGALAAEALLPGLLAAQPGTEMRQPKTTSCVPA